MNQELSSFAARLRETIHGRDAALRRPDSAARCPYQESEFNPLALELFALQFESNFAYRKICEARKFTPEIIEHWTQIPAVPTATFKELELTSLALNERTAVFHSSGTTEQKPSRHFHNAESLAVYEASLWSWFESEALGGGRKALDLVILTPPPEQAPHSSLVHMFEIIRLKIGKANNGGASVPASRTFFGKISADGTWILDFDAMRATLSPPASRPAPRALFLLGTALSFVHLLDYLVERDLRVELPAASRVMETGGYKNRSRSMPKAELHSLITKFLGVPRENIICEYGMSELSSQAYSVASDEWQVTGKGGATHPSSLIAHHFQFPSWARAQIISPETGREVGEGETGLIRVFDLANVFSVAAIQTEDLGIRRGAGFELIGRAQLAGPRGCSLMTG